MRYIVVRFIKLLIKFNLIDSWCKITFKGKGVSLNAFYSQGHWQTRSSLKKKYRALFDDLFTKSEKLKWMDKFALVVFYNSRHDLDNVVGMEKVFVDALKREKLPDGTVIRPGYILDDSKRFYKGMAIIPDPTLDMDTFEFLLLDLSKW